MIYRHQVIKQADIVLAMFLLGNEFSPEQKKRNFDYYDPLTTGDSSLSACIQSIVAFEIGYDERALRYLNYAVLMDLADVGGNVRDGVHIASIGGTWMAIVYGLAGMRDYGGKMSFNPQILVDRAGLPPHHPRSATGSGHRQGRGDLHAPQGGGADDQVTATRS